MLRVVIGEGDWSGGMEFRLSIVFLGPARGVGGRGNTRRAASYAAIGSVSYPLLCSENLAQGRPRPAG